MGNLLNIESVDCLGISRKDMPQINGEQVKEFVKDLKGDGVACVEKKIDPNSLKPTQSHIDSSKVEKYDVKAIGKKPILVSKENRIVDGHHQWAKAVLEDKDVKVIKINMPIRKLLEEAKDFSKTAESAFFDELNKIAARSHFKRLQDDKVALTDSERADVMSAKAVWHHGRHGEATPAVWKSVAGNGTVTYVTNTHRLYKTSPTLKGAISLYHSDVKETR